MHEVSFVILESKKTATGSFRADRIISICYYEYKMTTLVEYFSSKMFSRNGHLIINSINLNDFQCLVTKTLFLSKGYFQLSYSYSIRTEIE